MKKIKSFLIALGLLVTVLGSGQTQLNFKFANPHLYNDGATDYLIFDIQAKALASGYYIWSGQAILNIDATSLSPDAGNWIVLKGALLTGTYAGTVNKYQDPVVTSNGGKINIAWAAPAGNTTQTVYTRFNQVTTSYQSMVTVWAPITNPAGLAGISFEQASMDNQEFYKLLADPWFAHFTIPNAYEPADFTNLYLGRIYASIDGASPAWTQYGGTVDWTTSLNTAVWDGTATIPAAGVSAAAALRIHNGAYLTIPNTGALTVAGATEINTSLGLVIQSDAAGTGSLITGTVTGMGTVERYMSGNAWHLVSGPANQSIAQFLTVNTNVPTSGVTPGARGMMDYDTGTNLWNPYFTVATGGSTDAAKGFMVRTELAGALRFSGNLNAGANSIGATSDGVTNGFNLVGNPYTSAINVNPAAGTNFLDVNTGVIDPSYLSLYIWNDGTKIYDHINKADPNPVYASVGQGFFVMTNSGATNVQFTPAMQTHQVAANYKAGFNPYPTIQLVARTNSKLLTTDLKFIGGTTRGLDPGYDAGLMKADPSLVLYTKLVEDNGVDFMLQCLPDNDMSTMVIPVGLDSKVGGEVIFSIDTMNLTADCSVMIEDRVNKTFTVLGGDKVYRTSVEPNTTGANRFFLHTSYMGSGISGDLLNGDLTAYAVKNIEIRVIGAVHDGAVASLYDVAGRQVLFQKLTTGSFNIIHLLGIKEGVYMLSVKENGVEHTFKLPIKQ